MGGPPERTRLGDEVQRVGRYIVRPIYDVLREINIKGSFHDLSRRYDHQARYKTSARTDTDRYGVIARCRKTESANDAVRW